MRHSMTLASFNLQRVEAGIGTMPNSRKYCNITRFRSSHWIKSFISLIISNGEGENIFQIFAKIANINKESGNPCSTSWLTANWTETDQWGGGREERSGGGQVGCKRKPKKGCLVWCHLIVLLHTTTNSSSPGWTFYLWPVTNPDRGILESSWSSRWPRTARSSSCSSLLVVCVRPRQSSSVFVDAARSSDWTGRGFSLDWHVEKREEEQLETQARRSERAFESRNFVRPLPAWFWVQKRRCFYFSFHFRGKSSTRGWRSRREARLGWRLGGVENINRRKFVLQSSEVFATIIALSHNEYQNLQIPLHTQPHSLSIII